MNDNAIIVDGISKLYRIGRKKRAYQTLRDTIADTFTGPFRRAASLLRGQAAVDAEPDEIIWALKDVSFEIRKGEVVGFIGSNGAGKSTLLKILSRITDPTEGLAEIRGRVGSLLEVGTGFHPELTGRENIYLNGAILGMKRAEINRKFDEIVAFSEVERFVDTPVKHYSSGMYLRLAFAVAAHLEPEILIVDEVLAVGDASFQKKCQEKMSAVAKEGRTVLFVSHNMYAIKRLCERAILLTEGRVLLDGPAQHVVSAYLSAGRDTTAQKIWPDISKAPGNEVVRLLSVKVKTEDDMVAEVVDIRKPVGVEMEYEVLQAGYVLVPYYTFLNDEGVFCFEVLDSDPEWRQCPRPVGRYATTAWIPGNLLSEGKMIVYAAIITVEPRILHVNVPDVVVFDVVDSCEGDSARGNYMGIMTSAVRPLLKWSTASRQNRLKQYDCSL